MYNLRNFNFDLFFDHLSVTDATIMSNTNPQTFAYAQPVKLPNDQYIDDEIIAERKRREESLKKAALREKWKRREGRIGRDRNRTEANKIKVVASMKVAASKKRQSKERQKASLKEHSKTPEVTLPPIETSKSVRQSERSKQVEPFPHRQHPLKTEFAVAQRISRESSGASGSLSSAVSRRSRVSRKLPVQITPQDSAPRSAHVSKVNPPVTGVGVKPPKRGLFGSIGLAFRSFFGRKNTETHHDQLKPKPLPPIKKEVQESQVIDTNEIPPPNVDRDEHLVGKGETSQKEEEIPPAPPNVDRDKHLVGEGEISQKEEPMDPSETANNNLPKLPREKPERMKCEIGVQTEDYDEEFLDQSIENHNDMTQVGQVDVRRRKNRDTDQCDPNSSHINASLLSLSEGPLGQDHEDKKPLTNTRENLDRQSNVKDEISNKDKLFPTDLLPSSDESATLQSEKIEDEIPDRFGSSSRQQDLHKIKKIMKENFAQNELNFSDWLRLIHSGFGADDEFEIDPNLEIKIYDLDPNKDYDKHLDLMMEELERENEFCKFKLKRLEYEREMRLKAETSQEEENKLKEKNKEPILLSYKEQKEEDYRREKQEEAERLRNFMKQFPFDPQHPNKTPDLESPTPSTPGLGEFDKDYVYNFHKKTIEFTLQGTATQKFKDSKKELTEAKHLMFDAMHTDFKN